MGWWQQKVGPRIWMWLSRDHPSPFGVGHLRPISRTEIERMVGQILARYVADPSVIEKNLPLAGKGGIKWDDETLGCILDIEAEFAIKGLPKERWTRVGTASELADLVDEIVNRPNGAQGVRTPRAT